MRILHAEDYEKLGQEVANKYLRTATPIEQSVVEKAAELSLNPDQIRNLVQAANTLAHLGLMDQKTDGDRVVDFTPADPEVILRKIYIIATPADACPARSDGDRLCDFFSDLPSEPLSGATETTTNTPTTTPNETPVPNPEAEGGRRVQMILRIRKVAEEIDSQRLQAAVQYREELDKLAGEFARLYGPDFLEFEKDAYALYGDRAAGPMQDIRACLRLSMEKTAEVRAAVNPRRMVDSTGKLAHLYRSLRLMVEAQDHHLDCQRGLQDLQQKVGGLL